jgi:hypothetical protein
VDAARYLFALGAPPGATKSADEPVSPENEPEGKR